MAKNGKGRLIIGTLILAFGTWALIKNEVTRLKTASLLDTVASSYVELEDPGVIDPALNGKIIHSIGLTSTEDILTDEEFGLSANALILKRSVEYYQYEEHTKTYTESNDTRVTEYSYSIGWNNQIISSKTFYDESLRGKNVPIITLDTLTLRASEACFGAYKLPREFFTQAEANTSDSHLDRIGVGSVSPSILAAFNERVENAIGNSGEFVTVSDGYLYVGADPGNPQPGDVRVSYYILAPEVASIMGRINGDSIDFVRKGGRSFGVFYTNEHPADAFLAAGEDDNQTLAWGFRVCGLILVLIAFIMIFKGVDRRPTPVPVLSKLYKDSIFLPVVVFIVGWTAAAIGLGRVFLEPVSGVLLLLGGCGILGGFIFLKTKSS